MFNRIGGKLLKVIKRSSNENMEMLLFEYDENQFKQIALFHPEAKASNYDLNFTIDEVDNSLKIGDIVVPKGHREGFGTILVEAVLELSKERLIERVWGNLSYDDLSHKVIQVNFYRKNGFVVNEESNIIEMEFKYRFLKIRKLINKNFKNRQ